MFSLAPHVWQLSHALMRASVNPPAKVEGPSCNQHEGHPADKRFSALH